MLLDISHQLACNCTILLETYFSKNRQVKYNKNCDSCLAKRKAKRATPEAKAKRKAYYEKTKETIKAQGRAHNKIYYEANKEHTPHTHCNNNDTNILCSINIIIIIYVTYICV